MSKCDSEKQKYAHWRSCVPVNLFQVSLYVMTAFTKNLALVFILCMPNTLANDLSTDPNKPSLFVSCKTTHRQPTGFLRGWKEPIHRGQGKITDHWDALGSADEEAIIWWAWCKNYSCFLPQFSSLQTRGTHQFNLLHASISGKSVCVGSQNEFEKWTGFESLVQLRKKKNKEKVVQEFDSMVQIHRKEINAN